MSKFARIFTTAIISVQLAACASIDARPKVISSTGVNSAIERSAIQHDRSSVKLFVETAHAAYPESHDAKPDIDAQRRFLHRGFALVKDKCRIYLSAKADRQRDVNVWRDTFAPITALATGVIGLIDSGDTIDSDYLVGLGVVTSAATSGFDIYEERYLFGAQNVDSVRSLVERALNVDAKDKLAQPDSAMNYTNSVDYIVGNQMICSPHHILRLVNEAIKAGTVVPINRNPDRQNILEEDLGGSATPKPPEGVEVI